MNDIHVLHIVSSGDAGGAQQHVRGLFGLTRTSLLTGTRGWLVEEAERAGVPVRVVPPVRRALPIDLQGVAPLVRALVEGQSVDLVHAHGVRAVFVAKWALARVPVPIVYTSHGFAFASPTKAAPIRVALRTVERWRLGRVDAVIGVSHRECELAEALGWSAGRVFLVPNGIEPGTRPLRDPRPIRNIGAVGRLVPEKGFDRLISLARRLPPEVTVSIAGDGPLESELKRQAAAAGVKDKLRFVGWQGDSRQFLGEMDVFVLPSRKEGLPYALLEAMAEACAVVAMDVGGVADVVEDGRSGVVVRSDDDAGFMDAVLELVGDPRRAVALGWAARSRVEQAFSLDLMRQRTLKIYVPLREGAGWKA